MSSTCSTCAVQPYLCPGGKDCSKCPAPVAPPQYPPTTPSLLAQALVAYNDQANCPLNLSLENPEQWCYFNQLAPSPSGPGAAFIPSLPTNTVIGVDRNSWAQGPSRCDQYYLIPPFDSQNASEIEFLTAPPDASGNPQCSYFDNYTPANCTTPQCDCTTRCLYDGSMPCIPGTTAQKVGPCLSMPGWNGWTLQGYQCKSVKWGCNWQTGKCELMPDGAYTDEAACDANCIVCPSAGFQVLKDASGNQMCYRTPWNAVIGDAVDHCDQTGAVCRDYGDDCAAGANCSCTNDDTCGTPYGWVPHCSGAVFHQSDSYCNDQYTTPYGAMQCTNQGYVQCLTQAGCPPQSIEVSDDSTKMCVLPPSLTLVRGDEGSFKVPQKPLHNPASSTWFQ